MTHASPPQCFYCKRTADETELVQDVLTLRRVADFLPGAPETIRARINRCADADTCARLTAARRVHVDATQRLQ